MLKPKSERKIPYFFKSPIPHTRFATAWLQMLYKCGVLPPLKYKNLKMLFLIENTLLFVCNNQNNDVSLYQQKGANLSP